MSGYNFDFAISADITTKVVKEMIAKAVEEQTGRKVAQVTLNVGVEYEDRPTGMPYSIFKGATVTFANDNPN